MAETDTAEAIDRQAAAWAARLDRAPFTEAEQRALDAWTAEDPRHLGAYAKARAVALHSRRAAALTAAPKSDAPRPSRRLLLAASLGAASLGGVGFAAAYLRRSRRIETARGEVRSVTLDDGSIVSLNTLSRIDVRFNSDVREVVLSFGEALIDVATRRDRPFLIRAANATMTTQGGAFLVKRLEASPLQVTTLKGALQLVSDQDRVIPLTANQTLVLGDEAMAGSSSAPTLIEAGRADSLLAWRDGKLAFHDDTLNVAAAQFSRFRGAPIQFGGAKVAQLRITGLFEANDPAGFARAVAHSLNLRAEIGPKRILLSQA
ncbi:fec operon regulator FecR [Brevundimonas sp. SH203]|uniref:FecR family protein n=1 Tax=Brevundimonas sp. SH203 TaxID=345167 RepID=UPI0009D2E3B9|nr:FecR domain-containing protein [Brevundimonas sp. SH203]GAW41100.1 fec operon regulator FecR [Brevundimonas sp. SH203]